MVENNNELHHWLRLRSRLVFRREHTIRTLETEPGIAIGIINVLLPLHPN